MKQIADFVDVPVGTVRSRLIEQEKCCFQNFTNMQVIRNICTENKK